MATLIEGDPKATFSITTTTPFPGLLHFTLDLYLIMLSVKQGCLKYHFFESLVWLDLGLNPGLLDHWQWTILFEDPFVSSIIWLKSYSLISIINKFTNVIRNIIWCEWIRCFFFLCSFLNQQFEKHLLFFSLGLLFQLVFMLL